MLAHLISSAQAIEINWYGASCLSITDDKTRIIIDPFLTRPSLWKVLTNQALVSDTQLVNKFFGKDTRETIILITHTHFDHILDLPAVLKANPKALVYGPSETIDFLKLFKIDTNLFNSLAKNTEFKIGQFTIQSFDILHSELPLGFSFSRGKMNSKMATPLGAQDYKSMNSHSFLIKHKDAKILLHPSSVPQDYNLLDIDLLIVGLTSIDIGSLKKEVIDKVKAKKVFAIHHDNFFKAFDEPLAKMPFFPTLEPFLSKELPISIKLEPSL
jgi:L-ascorbate metabolism protein UlaG (beta-lactamase superfamily)